MPANAGMLVYIGLDSYQQRICIVLLVSESDNGFCAWSSDSLGIIALESIIFLKLRKIYRQNDFETGRLLLFVIQEAATSEDQFPLRCLVVSARIFKYNCLIIWSIYLIFVLYA